jgi:hypothetical protein
MTEAQRAEKRKGREPLKDMNHLIPKDRNRLDIQPIRDGVPVGTIRTQIQGTILPCGHRNVLFGEDEKGKYYECFLGHKHYLEMSI